METKTKSTNIVTYGLTETVIDNLQKIYRETHNDYEMEQNFVRCVIRATIAENLENKDIDYISGQLTGLIMEIGKKYKSLGYIDEKIGKVRNAVLDYTR